MTTSPREVYQAITANIEKVMKGQTVALRRLLAAFASGGHVLLEDFPGTGKTTLAKALARSVNVQFKRVQFTPDLLPSDIVGVSIFDQRDRQFQFHEGPVFTNILLADEINRASPRTQSALLEAMAEGQVTVEGERRALNELFFVVATQNPVEFRGTYPLPEAQMDRFAMQFELGYVSAGEEVSILSDQIHNHPLDSITPCANAEDVLRMRTAAAAIRISEELKRYIVDIVGATRGVSGVQLGASPRASLAVMKTAQALALFDGREFVTPEQIQEVAVPVIAHRLVIDPQAKFSGTTARGIAQEILRRIPRAGLMAMFRRYMYRSHRRFAGLAYWAGRRYTLAGKFTLACLLAAALLGLDTTRSTAYQAFTFLAAVVCVSFVWSLVQRFGRTARQLSVQRRLPRFGTVGSPVVYHLEVSNGTGRRQRAWLLQEDLDDPRPSLAEFVAKPARPARGLLARFDWFLGYSRWWQLMARRQMAVIAEQSLPDLPPHGDGDVRVEFTPKRRGRVHFTGITLARPDIFGLMRTSWRRKLPQSLLVLPKRYFLPRLALPGVREYQPAGVALASAVGNSDEFVALRDYRPGDPLRHIHWSSVAKTDRLIVREHEDEFFVRHALILDTFAAPDQEDVFEEAVSVAASFVCTIQTQESLLDLLFVGPEAYCFTAGRGVGNVDRMLEVLAGVSMCADHPFPALEALVLRHAGRVSGCVCVFVAWDEPRQRLVKLLQSFGVPLRVCVVTDDSQTEPLDAGAMRDQPQNFHQLRMGKIEETLRCI